MPWNATAFKRHNKGLSTVKAGHAARVANAILERTGDEGMAIATASAREKKRADGGSLDPSMATRYATMPTDRLEQLSGMLKGTPQADVIGNLLAQRPALKPQELAQGGFSPPQMAPAQWWTHSAAYTNNRPMLYLSGSTPGRADAVHTTAPGGAHIIPADVVSALGEGNGLNGAKVMEQMLSTGPYGVALHPTPLRRMGPPRYPAAARKLGGGENKGGGSGTAVALSDGEAMVFPHWVAHLGGGDPKRGRRILNHLIVEVRKQNIRDLQKLPGPVKEGTK